MSSTIYQLIPEIMKELGPVGMTGLNEKQNYKYRSVHKTIDAISPVLSKHGVFAIPTVIECDQRSVQSKTGGTLNYSKLKVAYTFYGPAGDSVQAVVEGEGMDSGDKGINKALSACYKYALGQVFCIPFGFVDSEIDSPEGDIESGKRKITDKQRKMFMARFGKKNYQDVIRKYGYFKVEDILMGDFNKILDEMENVQETTEDDVPAVESDDLGDMSTNKDSIAMLNELVKLSKKLDIPHSQMKSIIKDLGYDQTNLTNEQYRKIVDVMEEHRSNL